MTADLAPEHREWLLDALPSWVRATGHGMAYVDLIAPVVASIRDEAVAAARDGFRVAWSQTIPGHLWDPAGRVCECGTEVGVRCDRETVEQHLARADAEARLRTARSAIADEAYDLGHTAGQRDAEVRVQRVVEERAFVPMDSVVAAGRPVVLVEDVRAALQAAQTLPPERPR